VNTEPAPRDKIKAGPELTPPDAEQNAPDRGRSAYIFPVVIILFFSLALAGFFLFFQTKKNATPVRQQRAGTIDNAREAKEVSETRVPVDAKALALSTQLREHWLQLHAEAEADSIRDWGGEKFAGIREKAAEAELLMAAQQYGKAGTVLQQAISALEALRASRPALLADALFRGVKSLADGDGPAAAAAFTRALALDPGNVQATHGLARAKTLDQVVELYKKARTAEEQADLKAAEEMYARINTLDPEFQPAVQALSRVRRRLQDREFNTAMARFLQALAERKEKVARSALARAIKLRPQSPLVADGKRQLQQLVTGQTLDRLQRKYAQAVMSEQWQQAMDFCVQALKVDPQAAFALAGRGKAGRRLALDKALQNIIRHPQRLQEEAVLTQARQTLVAARSVVEAGPRLAQQIAAVDTLLAGANRRIEVVLQSDNATEVVIYRVGRLGRFSRRTLRLRPGRYTIVGSRPGFRDVRREFEVRPDGKQPFLQIRCTEVI
jgi:tetratricopeptide (TPR) repeat protein